ncbi:hypothetical protein JL721_6436 [Aureococcus anophagefferens]|nr:hypothetical protein JL721_6436 [Aureococcus anophagefferens]
MEVERPDAASSRAAEIDALACGGGVPALAEAHGYLDALLLERVRAKRSRDFAAADHARDLLRAAGVEVDDRRNTYRLGRPGPPRPRGHGYRRDDDGAVALTPDDAARLDALLLDRVAAKRERNFDEADRLRAALEAAGVRIDDRDRTYRVSGRRGAHGATATRRQPVAGWSRGGGAPRAVREAIRDELDAVASACGCRLVLDDDRRTYRFLRAAEPAAAPAADDAHGFARDDGGEPLPPAAAEAVDALLLARVRAKRSRDFDEADRLRGLLRDEHRVFVDDARTSPRRPLIERASASAAAAGA